MKLLRILPQGTKFRFMKLRVISYPISAALTILSIVLFLSVSLNYGIDFVGGSLLEIKTTDGHADLADMREKLSNLGIGEVQLQEATEPNLLGEDTNAIGAGTSVVLIKFGTQEGGDTAQKAALEKVKAALGENIDYRRVEQVGPSISQELVQVSTLAVITAIFGVLVYLWFRFEWPFAVGAIVATLHDVVLTIGVFAVTRIEFNVTSIAALLTIVGYSLNDTVVVFDRIRETLMAYKKKPVVEVLDIAINETLSRTIMTSSTTLAALFVLYFFGGETISSFTIAMIWGVIIGTYSSIFVASPVLYYLDLRSLGVTNDPSDLPYANVDRP